MNLPEHSAKGKVEWLQNTRQLLTTSFTCVEMLCRTRHYTIDTFVIQRDANKLWGILQFSQIYLFLFNGIQGHLEFLFIYDISIRCHIFQFLLKSELFSCFARRPIICVKWPTVYFQNRKPIYIWEIAEQATMMYLHHICTRFGACSHNNTLSDNNIYMVWLSLFVKSNPCKIKHWQAELEIWNSLFSAWS